MKVDCFVSLYPNRHPSVVWREEKGVEDKLLVPLEQEEAAREKGGITLIVSGIIHQLNLLGAEIWKLCDGTHTVAEIADILTTKYKDEVSLSAYDVQAFIADLLERGWLYIEKN